MANRQLLARATEGTSAPTPGYLYNDLARAASSNPSAAQEMATYLTTKLSTKQNCYIQYKCLKVIARLSDSTPAFRRCLAQQPHAVATIQQAINYRGPPDPVRGDEPNQNVRTAAQEALAAVYRQDAPAPAPTITMPGMGNPMFQDPRLDPRYNQTNNNLTTATSVGEAIAEAKTILVGMIKDPLAKRVDVVPVVRQGHSGNLPGYGGGGVSVLLSWNCCTN
jgi:hypothetical protein